MEVTAATRPASQQRSFILLAVMWLAGADLRLTILAVPPVLPLIHRDLALSEKAIGALSGLPILLLGLAAIPGSLLIARIGARRTAIWALVVVAAAAAARGFGPSAPTLFGMTVLMGAGIAIMQPAMPTLVAEWFPTTPGFATAIYANGLLVGETIPAAATIPLVLPAVGGSWPVDLALWSLPLAVTAAAMPFAALPNRAGPRAAARSVRWWPDWGSKLTWQLGLLTGGTGGLYFSSNAFIPDYLHAIGRPELVAASLTALNAGQLPASFLLLYAIRRLGRNRAVIAAMPLLALPMLAGLMLPFAWAIVGCAFTIGFCCSFVLIVSLALPPQLAPPGDVHRLSAGMFTVGYGLSCAIPPLGGAIWDATGVPASAFLAAALSAVIVAAAALTLDPQPAND